MSNTETGLDLRALSQLAAELAVSTGMAYDQAMSGLLDATSMAARLQAAKAKLAKIRKIREAQGPEGYVMGYVLDRILDEET